MSGFKSGKVVFEEGEEFFTGAKVEFRDKGVGYQVEKKLVECFGFQVWLGGFSPAIKHEKGVKESSLFSLGQFELFPVAMHPHAYGDFSLVE